MKNHKFFQLFKLLNKKEQKDFKNFAKSKYPSSRQLHALTKWLIKNLEEVEKEQKGLEDVHKALFKDQDFDSKKISNLMSRLYSSLKEFCVMSTLEGIDTVRELVFLHYLRDKNAFDLFHKEYKGLQRTFQQQSHIQHWDALSKMISSYYRFYYPPTSISNNSDLIEAWENHQLFTELLKLRFAIAAQNRQALLGGIDLKQLVDSPPVIVPINESNHFYPLVYILRALYSLYATGQEEVYFQAKNSYTKYYDKYTSEDKNLFLRLLLNFAIDRYKNGQAAFFQEIYDNYKFGVSSGALFSSNDLSSNSFVNVIDVACLAGDLPFAESFFEDFLYLTNKEEEENNRLMGISIIAYSKKEYTKSSQALQQLSQQNIFFKLKSFELSTRIAFETKEYEAIDAMAERFKRMIARSRQQAGEALFKPYDNYLKMLTALGKHPPLSKNQLLEKYANLQPMANNKWVNQQITSWKNL